MRKSVIGLGVLVSFAAALPGFSETFSDCKDRICVQYDVSEGPAAATNLQGWLGQPLPDGVIADKALYGGWQGTLVLARLEADDQGLAAFIQMLGLTKPQFEAANPTRNAIDIDDFVGQNPDWWDWKMATGLRTADTRTPSLYWLTIGIATHPDDAGRHIIYLVGRNI